MHLQEINHFFENWAPHSYQEEYDNSGWIVRTTDSFHQILITLDCTEAVIEEAIKKNCDLVIAHHPIVFKGLKSLTGKSYIERTVMKAIHHNISIYAIHTNLDNVDSGVNFKIGELLGLENLTILAPKKRILKKLYTFVPNEKAAELRSALFEAGAGHIGQYDECSYNTEGYGTFRAGENTDPYVGEHGVQHKQAETKVEVIFPAHLESKIVMALKKAHPYEEVAYDVILLENELQKVGSGMTGTLPEPISAREYLKKVKSTFKCEIIRYSGNLEKAIEKVAFCGGSGFFLLQKAIQHKADLFITGDVKYHDFFDSEDKIVLADIGHFESEQFTKDLIADRIQKNFPNFAVLISETNTNPVKYF